MTQKEQTRLQVLNSLLAEHIALDQVAELQGVSLRGIARDLGISRNTVRKYVDSMAPPINRIPRRSAQSPIQQNADGHFRWTTTLLKTIRTETC